MNNLHSGGMEAMTNYHNNNYQHHSALLNELIQGIELARQLGTKLGPEFSPDIKSPLLQQILSSCDKALMLLGGPPATIVESHQLASPVAPSSSVRTDLNVAFNAHHHHPQPLGIATSSKKRKATASPVKIKQVRAKPGNGQATRKKMQRSENDPTLFNTSYKEAHKSAKNPTMPQPPLPSSHHNTHHQYNCGSISYYHMGIANLPTMEDVSGSMGIVDHPTMEDMSGSMGIVDLPTMEDMSGSMGIVDLPTMEDMSGSMGIVDLPTMDDISGSNNNGLMNLPLLPTTLVTAGLDFPPQFNNSNDHLYPSYQNSPSYISPPSSTSSGSNYFFSSSSCSLTEAFGGNQYQQQNLDSYINEIFSAATSVTNSPRIEPDFSLHTWGFNSSFPSDDDLSFFC